MLCNFCKGTLDYARYRHCHECGSALCSTPCHVAHAKARHPNQYREKPVADIKGAALSIAVMAALFAGALFLLFFAQGRL